MTKKVAGPREKRWKDEYNSPFEKYRLNQSVFMPYIFKHYNPEWNIIWKPLEHLVDEYISKYRRGLDPFVTLRSGDTLKVMMMLRKKCNSLEMKTIETLIKMGRVKYELATAFGVEFSKAYPKAYDRAHKDFLRSDFRYDYEFFAIKFRLVKFSTPYEKRPKGHMYIDKNKKLIILPFKRKKGVLSKPLSF